MPASKDMLRSDAEAQSSAEARSGRGRVERIITSGGDTRPPRAIRRPLVVNIADQAGVLMSEPEWHTGVRNSITVATTDRVRVMLTALQSRGGDGRRNDE